MKIANLLCIVSIITVVMFLNCNAYADESNKDIIVRDVWIQAVPLLQEVTAAYMTIENRTPKEVYLLSASTEVAEEIEIHEMFPINGMLRMRGLHQIKIPSQMEAILNPEGFHLMMIKLKISIKKGDIIPIKLTFSEGRHLTVNATVREEE